MSLHNYLNLTLQKNLKVIQLENCLKNKTGKILVINKLISNSLRSVLLKNVKPSHHLLVHADESQVKCRRPQNISAAFC